MVKLTTFAVMCKAYGDLPMERMNKLNWSNLTPHPEASKNSKISQGRLLSVFWEGLAFESQKVPARNAMLIRMRDRAYAELERKCNEALQDLEKNPLVSDMRAEIKDLQGQVDGLHSEYSRLILEEKKCLKQDRAAVVSKVIPDAAMKLIRSDDLGVLIAKLVRWRRQAIDLSSKKRVNDHAGEALANAVISLHIAE
ncbi:hypothetical protein Tco_1430565 [Tanacetum coccineum]